MNLLIDVNKIVIPFIFSVYTTSMEMLFDLDDNQSLLIITFVSILFYVTGRIINKVYGKIDVLLYTYIVFGIVAVFLFIFISKFLMRDLIKTLFYVFSCVFIIIAIYQTLFLNSLKNKMYQYYARYINNNSFKPNFLIPFCFLLSYLFIIYPVVFVELTSENIIVHLAFLYFYTLITGIVFYKLLYKYKYAFYVIGCSEKNNLVIENICNEEYVLKHRWFTLNIEPYLNNIEYDRNKKVIYFKSAYKNTSKEENYTLYNAINTINSYMEQLEDEKIKNVVVNIKNELLKIDSYHQAEYKFNKYIKNINDKYMPYIEKLIVSYINNKGLPSDLTSEMQTKL